LHSSLSRNETNLKPLNSCETLLPNCAGILKKLSRSVWPSTLEQFSPFWNLKASDYPMVR
jgi:hypothetical protein